MGVIRTALTQEVEVALVCFLSCPLADLAQTASLIAGHRAYQVECAPMHDKALRKRGRGVRREQRWQLERVLLRHRRARCRTDGLNLEGLAGLKRRVGVLFVPKAGEAGAAPSPGGRVDRDTGVAERTESTEPGCRLVMDDRARKR
jgi:hypothetical protein